MVLLLVVTIVGAAAGFCLGWLLRNQAHAEVLEAMERRLRNAQRARLHAEEQLVVRRAHTDASLAIMRGELERNRSQAVAAQLD